MRSLLLPELIIGNELAKPHTDGYHGGTISDEVAALVSLLLGVRVRSAGTVRASGLVTPNQPPPEPLYFEPAHFLRPGPPDRELLPNLTARVVDLADLDLLHSFPELDEKSQTALVRASRSYASAIWWANEDPNLAWLQLVTAVEVIAKNQQTAKQDSVALLEEIWPELFASLSQLDGASLTQVAGFLKDLVKSTKAFVDFVEMFSPEPPPSRPDWDQLDWAAIRTHSSTIYNHRSKALHGGEPFPAPMLEAPRQDPSGAWQEVPLGLSAAAAGAIWHAKQFPMLLATFEYIARGSILNWWVQMSKLARRKAKPTS